MVSKLRSDGLIEEIRSGDVVWFPVGESDKVHAIFQFKRCTASIKVGDS